VDSTDSIKIQDSNGILSSGVATLGPTGALAPPSASVAPTVNIFTDHVHSVHHYIYIYLIYTHIIHVNT